jgi:hypothetical protein
MTPLQQQTENKRKDMYAAIKRGANTAQRLRDVGIDCLYLDVHLQAIKKEGYIKWNKQFRRWDITNVRPLVKV